MIVFSNVFSKLHLESTNYLNSSLSKKLALGHIF